MNRLGPHKKGYRPEIDRNPLFAIMMMALVFVGASSPACNPTTSGERNRIPEAPDGPCPVGRFPVTADNDACTCPQGQDKQHIGVLETFAECSAPPLADANEPVVDIECSDPPDECTYEGRVSSGSISEVSCGTLVCPEPICSIHCVVPPANCRYVGQVPSGACGKVTCGELVCEEDPRCPDGERRAETCWSAGVRGQARYSCEDGRWHAGPCELLL